MGATGTGAGSSWSRDYPKADRQFLIAMKRLTRIDARPVEQVVDLDSERSSGIEKFSVVCMPSRCRRGRFTEPEAKRLREYLLKGAS